MPLWKVYNDGSRKPKKVKGRIERESQIERVLISNPELLPHGKGVLWFSKTKNGPGDLVGLDKNGAIIVVEVKKRLGKREITYARKQVRNRVRQVARYNKERIEADYQYLKENYGNRVCAKDTFEKQFEDYFDRRLKVNPDKKYRFVVAESSTHSGERRMKRLERGAKRKTTHVVMHMVSADRRHTTISVEKLD